MDCRTFENRLEAFLEGTLSAAEAEAFEEHLAFCSRCRELDALVHLDLTAPPADPPSDLADGILRRTIGSPCARSRELLCDFVDRALDRVAWELVQLHLDGCRECRTLASALALLSEDLPPMARLAPPDAGFVHDVLAATALQSRRRTGGVSAVARAWSRLVARPRFAWEAAYVGLAALWLFFALPIPAARELPRRTAESFRSDAVARVVDPVVSFGRRAWEATGAAGLASVDGVKRDLEDRYRRTGDARRDLRRHGADLGDALVSLDAHRSLGAAKRLGEEAYVVWKRFVAERETKNGERVRDPDANPRRRT